MNCISSEKRKFNIFWSILVGATFLVSGLLIYKLLNYEDILCSYKQSCTNPTANKADKLIGQDCESVCSTKECVDISNFILSNMDQNANPCTDFYNFACGSYMKRYEGSGNRSILSLNEKVYATVRDIIEKSSGTPGSAEFKLKTVYNSCMNTGSSEIRSKQDILDFLRYAGIPNGLSMNLNFSFTNYSLAETLGKLSAYREDAFLTFFSHHDESEGFEKGRTLFNLNVGPSQPIFMHELEIKKLENTTLSLLQHFGFNSSTSIKTWKEFIEIERRYLQLLIDNSDAAELHDGEEFKKINCTEKNKNFICQTLDSLIRNGRFETRFNKHEVYLHYRFKYFIENIYEFFNIYSNRQIANYIVLRVFIKNLRHLNFSARKKLQVFLQPERSDDFSAALDKWKYCIFWIVSNMQIPLGAMYVEKMWSHEIAKKLDDFVQNIKNETIDLISQQNWIGEAKNLLIKRVAREKNLVYTAMEELRKKSEINDLFKRFRPSRTSFIRNVFTLQKHYFSNSIIFDNYLPILRAVDAFSVNAYGGDDIFLAFGVLFPPLYHHSYPNLYNIANTGQGASHEFAHSVFYFLDSEEIDQITQNNFKEKLQCLIQQYSRFEIKRLQTHVLGNRTATENFPDNMALRVIEKVARKELRKMTGSYFALPGLPYSPEELFYISYAQAWCEVRSLEMEKEYYERDYHCAHEFRIKGTLQNSKRFSEVFNCPRTSFMNLNTKCLVFE